MSKNAKVSETSSESIQIVFRKEKVGTKQIW